MRIVGLVALIVAAGAVAAQAQAPAATAPPPANDPTLVVVNDANISKSQVRRVMEQIELSPDAQPKDAYDMAVNLLVNTELLLQFLKQKGITVSAKEIEDSIDLLEERLKAQGTDIATAMGKSGATLDAVKEEIVRAKLWEKYCMGQATKEALAAFVAKNKDVFDGVRVRARHILLKIDPAATPAQKEELKAKLASIKQEVESGKLDFADAANKYSQDDGNVESKTGGDLGAFRRKGDLVEEFASAAFALQPGKISEPVESEFGYHLILVTEREPGQPFDMAKNEPFAFQQFEDDLRNRIITEAKAKAKVDVKAMPPDLAEAVQPPAEPTAPAVKP